MKRITKYEKADKFVNSARFTINKMTGNSGFPTSKAFWIEIVIRQAYLKGYKAGMGKAYRNKKANPYGWKKSEIIN